MEQSRNEAILKSILAGEEYKHLPQSRIEALLIEVGELIKGGGASPEQIKYAIDQYLEKHPLEERDPVAMGEIETLKEDIANQEKRIEALENGGSGIGTPVVDEYGNLTFTGKTQESVIVDENGNLTIGGIA